MCSEMGSLTCIESWDFNGGFGRLSLVGEVLGELFALFVDSLEFSVFIDSGFGAGFSNVGLTCFGVFEVINGWSWQMTRFSWWIFCGFLGTLMFGCGFGAVVVEVGVVFWVTFIIELMFCLVILLFWFVDFRGCCDLECLIGDCFISVQSI